MKERMEMSRGIGEMRIEKSIDKNSFNIFIFIIFSSFVSKFSI